MGLKTYEFQTHQFGLSSTCYDVFFVILLCRFICVGVCVVLLCCLVCRHLIATFGLSSTCYDVVFVAILLCHFICVEVIQIGKVGSIR